MSTFDFTHTSNKYWLALIGIVLFGAVLPLLASHGVLKVWVSLKPKQNEKEVLQRINIYKRLLLGWLVVLPVYTYSLYTVNFF